jgi:2-keto-4-pentenoate hydratase/2-oxohepta-3-ene-1,7-dioic acid hydratase in catechol pathway
MCNRNHALIENASLVTTLEPGDVIATGTNHQGLGALQDGDQVVMRIEPLGELRVTVRDPQARSWPRGVDEATAQRARA